MYTVKAVLSKRIEIPNEIMMLVGSFIFAMLIAVGAFVYIPLPFTPVPITLQVLFVLLCGIILGGRYGTLSTLLYVLSGAAGLPVFAGAFGGMTRILGPTGGYIIGFLIAPSIISLVFKRTGKRILSTVVAMCLGLLVIYLTGILHLSIFLKSGFLNAVKLGILPFIPGDTIKIVIASFLVHTTRRKMWN